MPNLYIGFLQDGGVYVTRLGADIFLHVHVNMSNTQNAEQDRRRERSLIRIRDASRKIRKVLLPN